MFFWSSPMKFPSKDIWRNDSYLPDLGGIKIDCLNIRPMACLAVPTQTHCFEESIGVVAKAKQGRS